MVFSNIFTPHLPYAVQLCLLYHPIQLENDYSSGSNLPINLSTVIVLIIHLMVTLLRAYVCICIFSPP